MQRRFIAGAMLAASLALSGGPANADEIVAFTIEKSNYSIPTPLTSTAGNADNGRQVVINRVKGNCLGCHTLPMPEQPFHGLIGPPLEGVGGRYDVAQLRLRVVNMKLINPGTIMPAFYRTDGLFDVLDKFAGKTILTAQEIEDVVAYLATLK